MFEGMTEKEAREAILAEVADYAKKYDRKILHVIPHLIKEKIRKSR